MAAIKPTTQIESPVPADDMDAVRKSELDAHVAVTGLHLPTTTYSGLVYYMSETGLTVKRVVCVCEESGYTDCQCHLEYWEPDDPRLSA